MRMYDIILKKRNGEALTKQEIEFVVEGYTKGSIPDYQMSSLLMAIFFSKMNKEETANLTLAMAKSGDMINLEKINGVKVDKHSTGGVGDSTTIVLAPMVAALGIPVAKMSGRGLGHTGGTIDKLESFKNFSVELTNEEFIDAVNKINIAVVGQSGNLAPADKKIYALRDVTGTVDNISLIASSIMSKKIASGADAIVLDVKVGEGAFMKNIEDAEKLAKAMVDIGNSLNRKTVALITDMNQPLGLAIGNALEIEEAINTLKGNGPQDLLDIALELGSNMVVLANKASNTDEAKKLLLETIESGEAIKKLKEFISNQGGETEVIDDTSKLPKAQYVIEVKAERDGYINKIHSENVGLIAMELGAGRATKEDVIDLAVGIVLNKKVGEEVKVGDTLAYVHANDKEKGNKAVCDLLREIEIDPNKKPVNPLIYKVIK